MHAVSELEQKQALLRGLPSHFYLSVEPIMRSEGDYQQAVAKCVGREMCLLEKDNSTEGAFLPNTTARRREHVSSVGNGVTLPKRTGKEEPSIQNK